MFVVTAQSALAQALPAPLEDADFHPVDPAKAAIGHLLFYDKILSGNRNIACATCHHPKHGSSDGLSLGIGEGGIGLGPERTAGSGADRILKRIPRNAPGLWNLGARKIHVLFHDGRLSVADTYENGFNSPAEEWLPKGLDTILAAQAVFPLTSMAEMAGSKGENEIAGAVNDRIDQGWPIIAKRIRSLDGYGPQFVAAFEHIDTPEQVQIADIANALSAFISAEFRSHDSPFDKYLSGDKAALSSQQVTGMRLFYGDAGCAQCHSGPFFSDQKFHALALPAFGPGRTRLFDPYARDVGHMAESDRLEDAYRFRTPMLRNVALTAPYGHNGAYPSLRSMVEHHLDPHAARAKWQRQDANLPDAPWLAAIDFVIQQDAREMARQSAKLDITPRTLSDTEIDALVAFLEALTGTTSVSQPPFGIPSVVPSGLNQP